ncbi:unnamed protein product [Auanema sp. JU1783]|nr:unnamed protein product [Auanema sp. JU1783]
MDDLLDVIVALSVLTLGVIGGLILIIKNVKVVRRLFSCHRKSEDVEKAVHRRTTIRVVRKAGTIHGGTAPSVASKTPVKRIFSNPLPTPPSATKAKEFVYIVPRSPTYKMEMASTAHSVVSPQTSLSTTSTYLPSQLPPVSTRRGSC